MGWHIVESSELHVKAWEHLANELHKPFPHIPNLGSCGLTSESVLQDVLCWTHDPSEIRILTDRKEAIFRGIVDNEGIQTQPGVLNFLQDLQTASIPTAIGTSAPKENVIHGSKAIGYGDFLKTVISSNDVEHGKPAPDIFVKAANALGIPPERCIVFEDAPAGIQAGLAAGMQVIAIASSHEHNELLAAHRIIQSFDELSPSTLNSSHVIL